MSVRIAICDDEKAEVDYIEGLVRQWAASGKIGAQISGFDSAEAFLFAYNADKSFDILLLDIQMKGIDGIALAKKLRANGTPFKNGGDVQIVFITGFPDFISEGYDVSALHYLMKPVSRDKLFEVLDKALGLIEQADKSVLVETSDGHTRLSLRDIHFVEAFAHTTAIETAAGTVDAKCSIGELEEMLGDGFIRTHRSYLVGLRHIRQITKSDVIMDSGKVIPLARRRYDAVNRAFIQFYAV